MRFRSFRNRNPEKMSKTMPSQSNVLSAINMFVRASLRSDFFSSNPLDNTSLPWPRTFVDDNAVVCARTVATHYLLSRRFTHSNYDYYYCAAYEMEMRFAVVVAGDINEVQEHIIKILIRLFHIFCFCFFGIFSFARSSSFSLVNGRSVNRGWFGWR